MSERGLEIAANFNTLTNASEKNERLLTYNQNRSVMWIVIASSDINQAQFPRAHVTDLVLQLYQQRLSLAKNPGKAQNPMQSSDESTPAFARISIKNSLRDMSVLARPGIHKTAQKLLTG